MVLQTDWKKACIENSLVIPMRSVYTKTEYQIKVWVPETYEQTNHNYPVLYLMDGDYAFGMAVDIVQYLIYGGHIPPLIIISPSYGTKILEERGGKNQRTRELNPFPSREIPKPKGIFFLEFLLKELIPFVEKEFRIDPRNRTLSGFSFGAVFTLFALFEHPEKFIRYVALDGYNSLLNDMEKDFKRLNSAIPGELYIASGLTDMQPFYETMMERHYTKFSLTHESLSSSHFAVPAEGLTRGLIQVFKQSYRG